MSLLKKIGKGLKKVVKVAGKVSAAGQAIANPAAYAMQIAYSGANARQQFSAPPRYSDYGGPQGYGGQSMSMIRTGGQPARLGQTRRGGGAIALAKKIPGPVGLAATAGMMLYDSFGNPIGRAPRRARAKGITATQLKAFTRVTHILDKYCKVKPPGGARRTTKRATKCR
jgi:hypothetical protein